MLQRIKHILLGSSLLVLLLGVQAGNAFHSWEDGHQHEQSTDLPVDCDLCDLIQNYQHQFFDLSNPTEFGFAVLTPAEPIMAYATIDIKDRSQDHPSNKAPPVLG